MAVSLPRLRVGEPQRHETLSVFPIFSEFSSDIDYRLSDEALIDQTVVVEEISEDGSVPDLLVENKGDQRVLFLEGEELVGAKQNRILNTSVLIAARTKIQIPVSCVEQGRWHYKSRYFGSSGSQSPSKLRQALKASVSQSIKERRGHISDQRAVWREVAHLNAAHSVKSGTGAMSDAFDTYQDRIASFKDKLKYFEGATGMAIAVGENVVSVDLFDKPSTCRKVWDRLLSGMVLDALRTVPTDRTVSVADIEQLLDAAGSLVWEQAQAVGEGEEYRAESKRGDHASALLFEGAIVHGSVVAAV
jgi:hypothetical protein